ncbi:DUF2164 domain-containing protein [Peribacillus sp. SCS-155]|uniref:DUF2164 domain-containing protein n=1 Tax=Peribacillus sedimenti TaxID=3115297 RepID=UPI0039062697
MISKIQEYVYKEEGKEIGELAAGNHLEFILEEIAPYIYNEAIKDAKKVIQSKMDSMDEDIASLERPL